MSSTKGREKWGTKLGVVLAMAANAVGLGNFLRFPVQCAQNGGGAFMIPYFAALLLLGLPLMWIEWGIGRYGGKFGHGTTPGMFHHLWSHPVSKYLGAIGLLIPFCLFVYYTYIESWTLAYSVFSFAGKYFHIEHHQGMVDFLMAYQGKTRNEYFGSMMPAYFFLVVTLGMNLWILSQGIVKGIERLVKIAMPLIVLFGVILMLRVFTLGMPDPAYPDRNVLAGLGFVWNPDFRALGNSRVWMAAAGQIFFTLSVGFAAIHTYASYLSEKDDIALKGLSTTGANEFVEVVLGGSIAIPVCVAFFGLAGTQAIAASGSFDLGFFAMPLVFQKMPMGHLFGTLWFVLLFLAGVTSSVAMAQPIVAFLEDEFKIERKRAVLIVGTVAFICMHPVVFFLKYGVLDEFDFWIGTFGLVVFAVIEVVLFFWVFGADKAWKELHHGAEIRIPHVFFYIMKYVTPAYLILLLGFWFFQDGLRILFLEGVPAGNAPYIWFARFLMAGLGLASLFLVRLAWSKRRPGNVTIQHQPKGDHHA